MAPLPWKQRHRTRAAAAKQDEGLRRVRHALHNLRLLG